MSNGSSSQPVLQPKKEYLKDVTAKKQHYLDDLRPKANLKKGSVDKTGAAKNKTTPNILDNYVVDLQTDLINLGFAEVVGLLKVGDTLVTDGIFGYKTHRCVRGFQWFSEKLHMREVNGKLTYVEKTMESKADGIVGPQTKKEIKLWKEKGYKNPWDVFYGIPLIRQTEGDCHIISIQMVLKYNGIDASREEIVQKMGAIGILKSGPDEDEQIKGAKNWGLGIKKGASYTFDQWKDMLKTHGPLIVTWGWRDWEDWEEGRDPDSAHSVVVTGLSKDYGGDEDNYVLQHNPWGQYEEFSFKGFRELIEGSEQTASINIYYYKGPVCSDAGTDLA